VETFTFLFTDIEGSTALLRRLGEGLYTQLLADHHSLIRTGLAAHDGKEVDTQGDAFFAVFSSPRACIAAVLEMQQALEAHAWPARAHVRVRIGVHTGEAARTATGLVGLDVHRAARVAAVGYGGQVLLSETAAALVRDALPPGAALTDLGVHRLKDMGRPERIFQLQAAGLQAEFPPLRSLGSPALPTNLPAHLATFIGRDREISEVRALMESSRLVTLTGTGGCGKTRLSIQLAAGLLDGSGDGVWLVELAALFDDDAVAPAICQALRIASQPSRPVLDTLLDALAPQDVLIVLDNCEHLIGACAKTADAILRRCPRVHLVATSREPLGIGGETIYRVLPLSLPGPGELGSPAAESSDAVALFVERARAQGVDLPVGEQTGPLVVSICRRLDGLPLAIELAAARLPSLSLSGLANRLDQSFRLLTGGSRTALARQQTLWATIEWSYSLLHGVEQLLLRRLSVFAESFDLDAAEAVCGFGDIEAFDVTDLLGSLVDKSLVVAEPAGDTLRYRLLETIRQFAAERLADTGDDQAAAVEAAHCAHYLSAAETAAPHLTGPRQGNWLARLDADQANLRRAAEHAARDPDGTEQVLRLGTALQRYWITRFRDEEALALLLPALDRPEAQANPELFATALLTAGITARYVDLAAALRLGEQAVELARQLDAGRLLIESLAEFSATCHHAGEPERGLVPGREAVERARQVGDDVLLGVSLAGYLLCRAFIDPAPPGPLLTEAIACTQRSGDHLFAYFLNNNAGVHALRAGDIPAARAYLQEAAQAQRAIGGANSQLTINTGWVLRQDNDSDGARSSFEAVLRVSRRNGDRFGIAYANLGLACLAADAGNWHRAALLHGVAQAFLEPTGQPWQELEARYRRDSLDQVRAHLGQEQFERAHAKGMALSFDDALDLGVDGMPEPDPR
jgi:predicted ATPase/class 3 adenylate cyclase